VADLMGQIREGILVGDLASDAAKDDGAPAALPPGRRPSPPTS
jgi:hypothetical protein